MQTPDTFGSILRAVALAGAVAYIVAASHLMAALATFAAVVLK